ncbi:MAG: hypothetical protein H6508_01715 [Calditrichaeota bacterium]|nr:hypothetical protein [Calditrichota bacterium]
MPNLFTKLILFASSYLPLWIIFAIQLLARQNRIGAYIAVGFAAFCFLGLMVFLKIVQGINPLTLKVASIQRRDGEAMSYIVTYLLPFIALPSCEIGDLLSLGIFLVVLAVLYVNSDMIHINPVLNLLGWHVYEIEDDKGHVFTILSKSRLKRGTEIGAIRIGEDMYVFNANGAQE